MQKIGDISNTRADSNGEFTDGHVAGGVPPTILSAEWFNTVQRELINAVQGAGLRPDADNDSQLYEAIKRLTGQLALLPAGNLSDLTDKAAALATLAAVPESRNVNGHTLNADIRLSAKDVNALPADGTALAADKLAIARKINGVAFDGSADIRLPSEVPAGIPLPWPAAVPPAGWLKCDGAAFNKTVYPKLAQAYPAGVLPDLRGEFIRGWDGGRGVDNGRAPGTGQSDEIRSHSHRFVNEYGTASDNFVAFTDQNSEGADAVRHPGQRAWTYVTMEKTGGSETRPRNIAFNYIVRAE